jgi:hypothetical protein
MDRGIDGRALVPITIPDDDESVEAVEAESVKSVDAVEAEENLARDPTIKHGSGVASVCVPRGQAIRLAEFLLDRWEDSGLILASGTRVRGYTSYENVAEPHDPAQQGKHTLLLAGAMVERAYTELPGFKEITEFLLTYLEQRLGIRYSLSHAHVLRQSQQTQMSTGFLSHQDLDTNPTTEQSIVVKVTPDGIGESPSRMTVVGAAFPFEYGPEAGAAGHFDSRLWHESVRPESPREHLKVTFFFRRSTEREMRAKRPRVA